MTTARKPQPQFTIQTIGQPCPSLLVGWAELLAIKAEEMSPRLVKQDYDKEKSGSNSK